MTTPHRRQASAAVTVLEQTTAPPPLPQIIADYVGRVPGGALGARLANPLSASMHLPRPPGGPPAALPDPSSSPPTPGGEGFCVHHLAPRHGQRARLSWSGPGPTCDLVVCK